MDSQARLHAAETPTRCITDFRGDPYDVKWRTWQTGTWSTPWVGEVLVHPRSGPSWRMKWERARFGDPIHPATQVWALTERALCRKLRRIERKFATGW